MKRTYDSITEPNDMYQLLLFMARKVYNVLLMFCNNHLLMVANQMQFTHSVFVFRFVENGLARV